MSVITAKLDKIASYLEEKGLIKEALKIDQVSDTIDAALGQIDPNEESTEDFVKRLIQQYHLNQKDTQYLGYLVGRYLLSKDQKDLFEQFVSKLVDEDAFGFDYTSQAIDAILKHTDWYMRWEVSPEMRLLGEKLRGMISKAAPGVVK